MDLKWINAKLLLKEGDILLFRAKASPFTISYWIAKYTNSKYSHCSLASLSKDGEVWCLEFRELIGSRLHNLEEEIKHGHTIDVFRIQRSIYHSRFNQDTREIEETITEFTPAVAKKITDDGKEYVTRKETYSYKLIWHMVGLFLPVYRLFVNKNPDLEHDTNKFVCSTFIAYLYRKNVADLVIGVSDTFTSPGDIARSNLLNYLFTIVKD